MQHQESPFHSVLVRSTMAATTVEEMSSGWSDGRSIASTSAASGGAWKCNCDRFPHSVVTLGPICLGMQVDDRQSGTD